MNSRSLRRLAADHGALHNNPLPPNYLFDPSTTPSSDLTTLDILLAGPTSTPYELGVFKLHLTIPPTYPSEPPKAFFRTKIFHPNVDDGTGAVCVETLKRDWDVKLTLRDVLVTISCLLVQPNASSALNADAGMLLEQGEGGWEAFEKRARLMTKVHAGVGADLKTVVRDAQRRGEVAEEERKDSGTEAENKGRKRRRPVAMRGDTETPVEGNKRRAETPPARPAPSRPFVLQSGIEDVFGSIKLPAPTRAPLPDFLAPPRPDFSTSVRPDFSAPPSRPIPDFSSSFLYDDVAASAEPPPTQAPTQMFPSMYKGDMSTSESSFEEEYPPSPKKSPKKQTVSPNTSYEIPPASPRKSPKKRVEVTRERPEFNRAESSRTAAERRLFFTPAVVHQHQQLTPVVDSSTFLEQSVEFGEGDTDIDASFEVQRRAPVRDRRIVREVRGFGGVPRLAKRRVETPVVSTPVYEDSSLGESSWLGGEVLKEKVVRMPLGVLEGQMEMEMEREETEEAEMEMEEEEDRMVEAEKEAEKKKKLEEKLWKRCGRDVDRWNRGDFGGFFVSGGRW